MARTTRTKATNRPVTIPPSIGARLFRVELRPWLQVDGWTWTEDDLLASTVLRLGFERTHTPLVVARTVLIGRPALMLTGERSSGCWGSVVVNAEADHLYVLELVASDRAEYKAFQQTWLRMIRRASSR